MKSLLPLSIALLAVVAVPAATALTPAVDLPVMTGSAATLPAKLPRTRTRPVSLRLGFTSERTEAHTAPALSRIDIDLSKGIEIDPKNVPSCPRAKLFADYAEGRRACPGSFLGDGGVVSEIAPEGGQPAVVVGKLLAFYSRVGRSQYILAQVTTSEPFGLVYVLPFKIESRPGPLSTRLTVHRMRRVVGKCVSSHPDCFGNSYEFEGIYSQILNFELFLDRAMTHPRTSFLHGRCPRRSSRAFPLARVTLAYEESGTELSSRAHGGCSGS